jgi:hypothetical protein
MQTMTTPLAFNHVGMTVPDIDRAIQWYGVVLGFRLIFRRLLEHRPDVPEGREIFGERFVARIRRTFCQPMASVSNSFSSLIHRYRRMKTISATGGAGFSICA